MIEGAVTFLLTVVAWILISTGVVIAVIVAGFILFWLWFIIYLIWNLGVPPKFMTKAKK